MPFFLAIIFFFAFSFAQEQKLGSIRVIPSVLIDGATSLIAYKISENAKITIEVFSYDMKKIRTIVKNAAREANSNLSANSNEDFWDGKDHSGKPAAMGTYYIKVSDNRGNVGWGKVMCLGGN
jgi:flagellar hook assembly protein FlgD